MNIDVGKAISELLFNHDTVIVPGFGGFTSEPESATVDYVQGVVTPPTKKISFNSNLVINDGILVDYIQKRDVVTSQQAKEAMEEYVNGLKAALERREIIEIPSVGRIYRDYEQQLKFMPEGTNFESNSFGLPEVKFMPVGRAKEPAQSATAKPKVGKVAAATQVAAAAEKKAASKTGSFSSELMNRLIPILITVAAVLLAFSLFIIFRGDPAEPVAGVDEERVNVKPLPAEGNENETASVSPSTNGTETDNEVLDSEKATDQKTSTTSENSTPDKQGDSSLAEASTSASPSESSVEPTGDFIVIHSFGVASNARKFERKLKRDGYEPRSVEQGGLHRVGVQAKNMTSAEIENMIIALGKKYKSTPKRVDY